ncbi:MAG: hypothetical protein BWY57_03220 [Betaproteobacteria bacterium ADurb.Bin341]|nr:MAG: hypothetical protein BWY57_03220 [Betaproteobacteria bacterium ADurb.Bin341]
MRHGCRGDQIGCALDVPLAKPFQRRLRRVLHQPWKTIEYEIREVDPEPIQSHLCLVQSWVAMIEDGADLAWHVGTAGDVDRQ